MTPEQVRDWVRKAVAQGADVIKIYATKSIREGGGQTMSDAQIEVACTEARAADKRIWVHAHGASAIRAAATARNLVALGQAQVLRPAHVGGAGRSRLEALGNA